MMISFINDYINSVDNINFNKKITTEILTDHRFVDSIYYAKDILYCIYDKRDLGYFNHIRTSFLLDLPHSVDLINPKARFKVRNTIVLGDISRFRAGSFGGIGVLEDRLLNFNNL